MGRIGTLGISSFCTQLAAALTMIVMNNLMRRYGAQSPYGSDIALSCYGVMMKLYQIAHAMFVGVSSGTQPIHGFNFGAKHYQRVRKTYQTAVVVATVISIAWFLIFQFGGRMLTGLFVEANERYLRFGTLCFRLYMLAFFLYGFPMVTVSFFQAIDKPAKALLLAVSRQMFFLIPLALLFSKHDGLAGALLAAPAADFITFWLALLLSILEFQSWNKKGV